MSHLEQAANNDYNYLVPPLNFLLLYFTDKETKAQ